MAEGKQVPLSIVLRTVDHATAGINAVNKRLDALSKPTREFGKALSDLAEKSGMNRVGDAFGRVGGAITDALGKVAMVGGIVGGAIAAATAGVLHLVNQFSELGHVAKRAGVEVDFLAGLRYAATKAGLPIEQLDEALITLTQNLGQAKTGTGRMVKFLQMASPALLHQLVNTHSTAEATGLLIEAMSRLPDAARRAALAQKTFGDSGLVLLANGGSKAVQAQMAAYAKLAPSMEGAVAASRDVKDAMHDLDAATDGVKAVLVTGLAPALGGVIEKMTAWLVGHREDIARWADDIGKRIPDAVQQLVTWVGKAYDKVMTFVEGIGGWKTVVLGVAAVIAGPLAASVAALGVALLATPFGQVLLALTPIVAAIASLVSETEAFEAVAQRLGFSEKKPTEVEAFKSDMEAMMEDGRRTAEAEAAGHAAFQSSPGKQASDLWQDQHDAFLAIPDWSTSVDPKDAARRARMAALDAQIRQFQLQHPGPQEIKIKVDFANAPKGMRAAVAAAGGAYVDMTTGFQGTGL